MADYIDEHMKEAVRLKATANERRQFDELLLPEIDSAAHSLADMVIRYREMNYLNGVIPRENFSEVQNVLRPILKSEHNKHLFVKDMPDD